ncbi:hypothetical protein SNEBB_008802 [Seison nebaliae]|nr:hypothetical protein SNEBB_008802 [Seison nebaliae]
MITKLLIILKTLLNILILNTQSSNGERFIHDTIIIPFRDIRPCIHKTLPINSTTCTHIIRLHVALNKCEGCGTSILEVRVYGDSIYGRREVHCDIKPYNIFNHYNVSSSVFYENRRTINEVKIVAWFYRNSKYRIIPCVIYVSTPSDVYGGPANHIYNSNFSVIQHTTNWKSRPKHFHAIEFIKDRCKKVLTTSFEHGENFVIHFHQTGTLIYNGNLGTNIKNILITSMIDTLADQLDIIPLRLDVFVTRKKNSRFDKIEYNFFMEIFYPRILAIVHKYSPKMSFEIWHHSIIHVLRERIKSHISVRSHTVGMLTCIRKKKLNLRFLTYTMLWTFILLLTFIVLLVIMAKCSIEVKKTITPVRTVVRNFGGKYLHRALSSHVLGTVGNTQPPVIRRSYSDRSIASDDNIYPVRVSDGILQK